jgi:hypothetical protein
MLFGFAFREARHTQVDTGQSELWIFGEAASIDQRQPEVKS